MATSSTTAQLNWTAVSGARGYRIFWQFEGQVFYLGTVGAKATSAKIVNLPPGSTSQFLVEAFNGSAVGDSAWVTVTTPAARPVDPVTVWSGLGGQLQHSKRELSSWTD